MSQRAARPLRLLGSSWNVGLKRGGDRASPVLAVYKPCGLPYFAASQLTTSSDGVVDNLKSNGSSGRHLFSASPHSVPVVSPSDTSDSLLTRMTDILSPGSGTPCVALPLIHPTFTRFATASQVNAITAQRKGTTLVACAQDELMFLRSCYRLGLVRSVYRVLCRLPPCVAARVRHALHEQGLAKQTTKAAFKNPYVQQFLQRGGGGGGGGGGGAVASEDTGICLGATLPRCAYPHPLLQGGFYGVKDRSLLRHGRVSGFLTSIRLPRGVQAAVKQQQRLKALFFSPTAAASIGAELPAKDVAVCDACQRKGNGHDDVVPHPWLGDDCRMRLGLDVSAADRTTSVRELHELDDKMDGSEKLQEKGEYYYDLHGNREPTSRHLVGKRFQFDFRLLTLNDACDLALYEVSTNDSSDEEIKAVFSAANLIVLNDYVNDNALAESMLAVVQQLHTLPQSRLANFPMTLQHLLRHGSPTELVEEPLLATSLSSSVEASGKSAQPMDTSERVRQAGLHGHRCYPLLLEVLRDLGDEQAYFRVIHLALGSGLECTEVHFPDPAQECNRTALQHLLLRMEQREMTGAYRESVAERMLFVSRGSTVDCETYSAALILPRQDDGVLYFPPQRDLLEAWGDGHPAVVRREECSELSCAYCGAAGHAWSSCTEGVPLLPRDEAVPTGNDSDGGSECSDPRQRKRAVEEAMLLSTVDDVTDALQGATAPRGSTDVVLVPNATPTKAFNPHAWRRNQERPSLHRHRLRCAYCSGRHHITQCPKIPDSSSGSEADGGPSWQEIGEKKLCERAEKLFCIKCGKHGHLYERCPLVPSGLHTATHCPICLLPHRTILHTPSQCPRRVTPPKDYSPGGMPLVLLQYGADGGQRGKRKSNHRGGGVLLSDSFLSQT